MVCKNHPNQSARRKCFLCKAPICPECQTKEYHHIFCGLHCAKTFQKSHAENVVKELSLSEQMNQLDQSLNEDFKEYGQTVIDQLQHTIQSHFETHESEFKRKQSYFEDLISHLKQSMLSQRTLFQEWSHEKNSQIQEYQSYLRKISRKNLRKNQRDKKAHNSLKKSVSSHLETHLKTLESRLSQVEAQHRQNMIEQQKFFDDWAAQRNQQIKTFESFFFNYYRKRLKQERRTRELQNELSQTIERRLENQGKQLDLALEALKANQQDNLTKQYSTIQASLTDLEKRFESFYKERTQNLLDDLSALLSAQKGNWNEIVQSAKIGAKDAGFVLRESLRKELQKQVMDLATIESEELKKVSKEARSLLMSRIQSQISPWPRRASLAAAILSIVTLFVTPILFVSVRNAHESHWVQWMESHQKVAPKEIAINTPQKPPKAEIKQETPRQLPMISNMDRGSLLRREVAFTFDGGSNSHAAEDILDILQKYNIKATMFLTGEFIEANPELTRRILSAGHEVGNHLYRHAHLIDHETMKSFYSKEELLAELSQVEQVFEKITHQSMSKYWRAPFGEVTQEQMDWARSKGYIHIGWTRSGRANLDTHDWVSDPNHQLFKSPDQIANRVLNFEKNDPHGLNGAIVLMHLGSERSLKDRAHLALPKLFDHLSKQGYQMVSISSILSTNLAHQTHKRPTDF